MPLSPPHAHCAGWGRSGDQDVVLGIRSAVLLRTVRDDVEDELDVVPGRFVVMVGSDVLDVAMAAFPWPGTSP